MRHTLIVDSSDYDLSALFDIFLGLVATGTKLTVMTDRPEVYSRLQSKAQILPSPKYLQMPVLAKGIAFRKLLRTMGVTKILLVGLEDKFRLSSLIDRSNLPVFWLELPEEDYCNLSPKKLANLAFLSTGAKALCLTNDTKKLRLDLAWPELSVVVENPALVFPPYQEAKQDFPWLKKPSGLQPEFTLGTVADLREVQLIEELLSLVRSCVELGHPLRLVVIGDGEEREKLTWLIRKMGMEHLVWLVGKRLDLGKWYTCFDGLAVANRQPTLSDLNAAAGGAFFGLPLLAESSRALCDLLVDGQSGELVEFANTEKLTATVLRWMSDREGWQRLSAGARQRAWELYDYNNKIKVWMDYLS